MENASKALIIAGSVLIAILLISLGLWVFRAPSDAIRKVGEVSGTLEVFTYNSQFTKYAGENVKGGEVKTLIDYVMADGTIGVSATIGGATETSLQDIRNKINTIKRYEVKCEVDTNSKKVNKIVIKEK